MSLKTETIAEKAIAGAAVEAASSFRFKIGDQCLCKWNDNRWYLAKVVQQWDDSSAAATIAPPLCSRSYLIHYVGWNQKYDEWVAEELVMSTTETEAAASSEVAQRAKTNRRRSGKKTPDADPAPPPPPVDNGVAAVVDAGRRAKSNSPAKKPKRSHIDESAEDVKTDVDAKPSRAPSKRRRAVPVRHLSPAIPISANSAPALHKPPLVLPVKEEVKPEARVFDVEIAILATS